jgi:hypothetical protein
LKLKTKLDISDADLAIMRNQKKGYKELIISYKTVMSNTYDVYVCDIHEYIPKPLYQHQSFQLWEEKITAFFLTKNRDYVTINS